MDKKTFYDAIRDKINLTTTNVMGMDKVIDYAEQKDKVPLNQLAYIMATGLWETGHTMQPVREAFWLSEAWRKKNLRYYPWYGRGLVQVTWEENYKKIGEAIGAGDLFIRDPNKLLEWEYALPALFVGMKKGIYTGKKLDDYIDLVDDSDAKDFEEYKAARRIVNGTDRDTTIANMALHLESGLRSSGYSDEPISDDRIILKPGDTGKKVEDLQIALRDFYEGKIDGIYGPQTEAAVIKFQNRLIKLGQVDLTTLAALEIYNFT